MRLRRRPRTPACDGTALVLREDDSVTAGPNELRARAAVRRIGAARADQRPAAGHRLRRSARVVLAWTGIAMAAGCSSDLQKLAKELEPARSWTATLQLAGESWLGNRVPSAYVRRTAGEAREQIAKSGKTVAQLVDTPAGLRDRAVGTLARAAATADSIARAIERVDTLQLRRDLAEIGVVSRTLDSLVRQARSPGS